MKKKLVIGILFVILFGLIVSIPKINNMFYTVGGKNAETVYTVEGIITDVMSESEFCCYTNSVIRTGSGNSDIIEGFYYTVDYSNTNDTMDLKKGDRVRFLVFKGDVNTQKKILKTDALEMIEKGNKNCK
ncbi:MAG: hypothetical protein IJT65_04955 [Eubacterium sp.]|nr:hypothetical protein [Eubacterium sp.]